MLIGLFKNNNLSIKVVFLFQSFLAITFLPLKTQIGNQFRLLKLKSKYEDLTMY